MNAIMALHTHTHTHTGCLLILPFLLFVIYGISNQYQDDQDDQETQHRGWRRQLRVSVKNDDSLDSGGGDGDNSVVLAYTLTDLEVYD